ncbi:MAG: prolyl oligopeptidase family serine peptidase [Myxococcota bacterium]
MQRVLAMALVAAAAGCGSDDDAAADGSSGMQTSQSSSGSTTEMSTSTTAAADTGSSSTSDAADGSSSSESSTGGSTTAPWQARGSFGVGVTNQLVTEGDRTVRATIWYPSDDASGTTPLADLVDEANAAQLATLMADAPQDCVRADAEAQLDAPLAEGTFPTVLYSHCFSCLGVSSSFIAERLASHGVIVVGVTHTGDTLFDDLAGNPAPLNGEWLDQRTTDVRNTLDAVTTRGPIAAAIDSNAIGMFGHSYGATTTGKVLQDDDRFTAGVAIAAPIENPLLPGVATADIAEPMLFLLMEEDNSIQAIGNNLLAGNAAAMPGGSWLVELADAGHWSPSDLCGIVDDFAPGCGDDVRQTNGEPFTYLPADVGRHITASYVTAFFLAELGGDAEAQSWLDAEPTDAGVTVTRFVP